MRSWFQLGWGRWLDLARYHWLVLLGFICVASLVFTWNSYGLVMLSMANVGFLETHGLRAVREGGLTQLLMIGGKGFVSLLSYLAFKGIEVELVSRWRSLGAPAQSAASDKTASPARKGPSVRSKRR